MSQDRVASKKVHLKAKRKTPTNKNQPLVRFYPWGTSLIIFFLLVPYNGHCQKDQKDSLRFALSKTQADSVRAIIYNELAWLELSNNLDSSTYWAHLALSISKPNDLLNELALAENVLGNVALIQGKSDSAIEHFNRGLNARKVLGNPQKIGWSYNNIGNYYRQVGNYPLALVNFLEAEKSLLAASDEKELIGVYNNLGITYRELGQYPKALEALNTCLALAHKQNLPLKIGEAYLSIGVYFETTGQFIAAMQHYQKAAQLFQTINRKQYLARTLHNIGSLYFQIGQSDSALHALFESVSIKESEGYFADLPSTYNNIGVVLMESGNLTRAKTYFRQALNEHKRYKNQEAVADGFLNLHEVYLLEEQSDSALLYAKKALNIATNQHLALLQLEAFERISNLMDQKGLFDSAFFYLKAYATLADTLKDQFTGSVALQFALEQKENERKIQETELLQQKELNAKQKNIIYLIAIVLLLLLLAGIQTLRVLLQRKRRLRIEKEQKELEVHSLNAVLNVQQEERERIAGDLHNTMGATLSALKGQFRKSNPSDQEVFQKACSTIDYLIEHIREVSHNLNSGLLKKQGLFRALEELIDGVERSTDLEIEFNAPESFEDVNIDLQDIAYKIVKELINNVIKHAHASWLSVNLLRNNGNLNIIVEDNGVEFKADQIQEGLGFKSIRSRLSTINGELQIDSGNGGGTSIIIDIPTT